MSKDPVVTWHFSAERKLAYGDDRPIFNGAVLTVEGDIALCERGLHGSVNAVDALTYAPGCVLSRCEHRGSVVVGDDKLVSSVREHIVVVDAAPVVVVFAKWCAARAADAARAASASYAASAAYAYAARADAAARAAYAYAAERQLQNEYLESLLFELIQKEQGRK